MATSNTITRRVLNAEQRTICNVELSRAQLQPTAGYSLPRLSSS